VGILPALTLCGIVVLGSIYGREAAGSVPHAKGTEIRIMRIPEGVIKKNGTI
jgi:hypothetical protein